MADYPRGKLNESDEGAVTIGVSIDGDCVVISFPTPTTWVAMPAEQAETLAIVIKRRAEQARRNRQ